MATVLSVNVGVPRSNDFKPERLTGIDKQPVEGPVNVHLTPPKGAGDVGLEGDRVFDVRHHGGTDQAVYAFTREDLDEWAADLGRSLPAGCFGENLTTIGIDLNEARIGERWRVGDSVVLQVTAPRIPCGTFQGWLGEKGWAARFNERAKPGAYFRVIEEGTVEAGHPIEVLSRPEHDVTVSLTLLALTTERHRLPELEPARDHLPADVIELLDKHR